MSVSSALKTTKIIGQRKFQSLAVRGTCFDICKDFEGSRKTYFYNILFSAMNL